MIKLEYIVFMSTATVFSVEALIHFMIGKHKLILPNYTEAFQIVLAVIIFSSINALLSKYILEKSQEKRNIKKIFKN